MRKPRSGCVLRGSMAVLVGAALLLGCEAAAPMRRPIRMGFSAWPGWLPWQIAAERGLFAAAGVEVELRWYESYVGSINDLASGALDANAQTLNDTLYSVAGDS